MELDQHHLTSRVAVSLLVAILAYLGLLLGGNLVISPAAAVNTLSSSGRDPQPPQLTARDAVRGVLATERRLAPKQAAHDGGSPAIAAAPVVDLAGWTISAAFPAFDASPHAAVSRTHQPRGPPAAA
ncbi:membrane protein [Rhizobium leguminosarum bv. trifolii CB782]|uniref:Uncharacterized protein n=1 Tax=Rhizobium hidalgonense TaxID=1538159 RepID=A0A2A6KAH3_9HYPH|nr:hypothetical protein [Rhizobium hidalgonense]AHG44052.1 membrane protein [Rhizobium leguminosarum bv. trifolii CB782]MDR9775499.1 hypothetical protein [Rhizobium hidalgonense]MDR9821636.1 hypothetical protein [Rhizobium hidalgonense]PDT21548.1 hypothetical protein CO674_21690 [Rhizobium hidalgonense]PON08201.1 hypothetical protein ATY29_07360 [Rhizobium hidalgonense]